MNYKIKTQEIKQASIVLPSSKSISNRVLIIEQLCAERLRIDNLSDSDDTQVLMKALQSKNPIIDVGHAGTAYRFMTAYLAQSDACAVLTGSDRMKQRPIKLLVEALRELGADISYAELADFPPLRIHGQPLKGGTIHIPGNISSQYLSALLLIAPVMKGGLCLGIRDQLTSKPYVAMTLQIMAYFGIQSTWSEDQITIPEQVYLAKDFQVESDWSAASYWYEILALQQEGSIFLQGLQKQSVQGDAQVATIFSHLGVQTSYEKNGVRISKGGVPASSLEWNFIEQPDLAQTIVLTCVALNIPFFFQGLATLKVKETNRIEALMSELRKFGYVLTEQNEGELRWDGSRCEAQENPQVDTYHDHRMALAFAPFSLKTPLQINDVEVVSKSYPQFWNHLLQCGYELELVD